VRVVLQCVLCEPLVMPRSGQFECDERSEQYECDEILTFTGRSPSTAYPVGVGPVAQAPRCAAAGVDLSGQWHMLLDNLAG
jgi:hypothetical protein